MELASAIASSSARERLEREDRPEDLVLDDLGVVARSARSASARRTARRAPAAAHDPLPVLARALDEAVDALEVVGVDQRRDRRRVVARVAEHVLVGRRVEALEELARARDSSTSSRVPDRQTWPASSYWPAALRAAASRSASAKTRNGFLPPSSAVNGTMLRAAAAPMRRAGLGRAGERHAPDQRVRDQRGARLLADALDDVEDARRQARLVGQLGEQRARERRPLGRLEDDRAAGGERRAPSSRSRA